MSTFRTGYDMVLEHGNLSRMLETAVVAARLAGQRAMEDMEFVKASVKNGNELVTQAVDVNDASR